MSFHALERLLQAAKAKGYVDTISLIALGVTSTLLAQTGYRHFYPVPAEPNLEQAAQIKDLSARLDKLTIDQSKTRNYEQTVRATEASVAREPYMDRSSDTVVASASNKFAQASSSASDDLETDFPSPLSGAAANSAKERYLASIARNNSLQRARSQSINARRGESSGAW